MRPTLEDRFFKYVLLSDGCWGWSGYTASGYGRFVHNGKKYQAHRASWELNFGPIPQGLMVCHKCDNPPCSNPDHLFLGTAKDNQSDKEAKGRSNRESYQKIPDSMVLEIAPMVGKMTWRSVAAKFGIPAGTIGCVLRRYRRIVA